MKPNFIKPSAVFITLLVFAVLALPSIARAQHIAPHGVTNFGASQLVAWYDESQDNDGFEGFSYLQVTNGSTDTGVNIHVQIFADDVTDSMDRCREHDFTDTLTATDTVVYVIGELDDPETTPNAFGGNNAGAAIPIDVDETRGFIVVTAVSQITLPRRAISHNHLFGTMNIYSCEGSCDGSGDNTEAANGFNTMGRQAVDFATGILTADGVLLDGVTNGYRLLQPNFLMFSFNDEPAGEDEANVVSIAFADNYSDPNGEYRAEPATAVWDPLMFNQFEQGTSCQQHVLTCFNDIGLNDDWQTIIDDFGSYTDIRLCPAVDLDGSGLDDSGWVDIAVSGLSGLDNNLGILNLTVDDSSNWADWMHSE